MIFNLFDAFVVLKNLREVYFGIIKDSGLEKLENVSPSQKKIYLYNARIRLDSIDIQLMQKIDSLKMTNMPMPIKITEIPIKNL